MSVKELSGMFLSAERWSAVLQGLQQPDCDVTHIRLFHNTAQHVVDLLSALQGTSCSATSTLTRLFIGDLDPAGARALSAFLAHRLCGVKELELQQLSSPTATAQALAPGLHTATSLQCLHVQRCEDDGALATLAGALTSRATTFNRFPLRLTLQRCRVAVGAAAALGTLVGCGGVVGLALASCRVSDAALQQLCSQAAQQHVQQLCLDLPLQHLDLSGNALGPAAAETLCAALPLMPSLQSLVLADNSSLGNQGISRLAPCVAACKSLVHLDLSGCGMGCDGIERLVGCLFSLNGSTPKSRMERLILDRNAIDASGFAAVAAVLACSGCGLRQLSAEACQISGTALAALPAVQQVAQVPPEGAGAAMQVLRLGSNPLGDKGLSWVVDALMGGSHGSSAPCGRALVELDLSSAGLCDTGADALLGVLSRSPKLHTLRVAANCFRDRGAARLCSAVAQHPSLRCFRADSCHSVDGCTKARIAETTRLVASRTDPDRSSAEGDSASVSPRSAPAPAKAAAQPCVRLVGGDSAFTSPVKASAQSMDIDSSGPGARVQFALGRVTTMEPVARCSSTGDGFTLAAHRQQAPRRSLGEHRRPAVSSALANTSPAGGAVVKHRLERAASGGADAHIAKHHHAEPRLAPAQAALVSAREQHAQQQQQCGAARFAVATLGTGLDAALLTAWQNSAAGVFSKVAVPAGKTFTGCSATSLGTGGVPFSPTHAGCIASVQPGSVPVNIPPGAADKGNTLRMAIPAKSAPVGGSCGFAPSSCGAPGSSSWLPHEAADRRFSHEVDRTSAGSSCSVGSRYSRRFRPLTIEQQAMFVDF